MSNKDKKVDPSKAQVGPYANSRNSSGGEDGGTLGFPTLDEGYDEEDFEKEASDEGGEQNEGGDTIDQEQKEASIMGSSNFEAGKRPRLEEPTSREPPTGPDPTMDRGTAPETLQDAVQKATQKDKSETQIQGEEQEYMQEQNRKDHNSREEYKSQDPEVGRIGSHPASLAHGRSYGKQASNELALIEDEEAHPIRVKLALDNKYGDEWYNWEPETIWETLDKDGIHDPAPVNKHRILSIKAITNTDEFFRNWRAFEKTCVAFSGREADFGYVQEVRLHNIAATVHLVRGTIKDEEFTDEVKSYISACAIRDGFVMLPEELGFASYTFSQEIAERLGDEVLRRQISIKQALDGEKEPEELDESNQVQFVRMKRVQLHVDSMTEAIS